MEESSFNTDFFDKFISFLNQNTTLLLALLLGFTFLLRMKYMSVNAGVWWDEADYLNLALHFGKGFHNIVASYREHAMTMVFGLIFRFGGEWGLRFVEQLFSVASVYFTYLIGKEFYSKRVGLVAGLMMAVIWVNMFWATRISMELHITTIWIIAAYLFWKGFVQNGKWWYSFVAGMLVGFGTYSYSSFGLSLFFYAAFVFITTKLSFLKSRHFWYAFLGAMIIVVPFAIYTYDYSGHIYPRFARTIDSEWRGLLEGVHDDALEKWRGGIISNFFAYWIALPGFLTWPFFAMLLVGLFFVLSNLILGWDLLVKGSEPKIKKDLYLLLWGLDVLVCFSLVYVTTGFEFDPRFLFPMYPAVSILAAVGLFKCYSFLKKYNRIVAFTAVSAILVLGAYSNVVYADSAINAKKDTYLGEREAGLWIKGNSDSEDYVFTCNQQVIFSYYTERRTYGFGLNATLTDEKIAELHPRYVLIDIYHPNCAFSIQQESKYALTPVYVTFADKGKTQPAVIVYGVGPLKGNVSS